MWSELYTAFDKKDSKKIDETETMYVRMCVYDVCIYVLEVMKCSL